MIDQVAVRRRGGFALLTIHEWSALDREERLQLLEEDRVEFLEDGMTVPVREALVSIREQTMV